MSAARVGAGARTPGEGDPVDAVLRALADPHRRRILRLVRGGELAAGSSTVEVVLTADRPDTVVAPFHHDLPAGEVDTHLDGWTSMLDRLGTVSAGPSRRSGDLRSG